MIRLKPADGRETSSRSVSTDLTTYLSMGVLLDVTGCYRVLQEAGESPGLLGGLLKKGN